MAEVEVGVGKGDGEGTAAALDRLPKGNAAAEVWDGLNEGPDAPLSQTQTSFPVEGLVRRWPSHSAPRWWRPWGGAVAVAVAVAGVR